MSFDCNGGSKRQSGHSIADPVTLETPLKPQCWDHGCNGRQYSTLRNLLRHQRDKSARSTEVVCHRCGAEFTRKTARDGHLAYDKCKQKSPERDGRPKSRPHQTPQLDLGGVSSINSPMQRKLLILINHPSRPLYLSCCIFLTSSNANHLPAHRKPFHVLH